MMGRLRALLSVTAIRLSVVYTLVFALVATLLVAYMTVATTRLLRSQIRTAVDEQVVLLRAAHEAGGMNRLLQRLVRFAAAPGANLYLVTGPNGDPIFGNVLDIEPAVIAHDGWTPRAFRYARVADSESAPRQLAIARIEPLPDGFRLLVGRDLGEPERFGGVVVRALVFSLLAMLALGLVTWVLVGRRALVRLDAVDRSTSRIMAGDLTQRLPVTGAGDEFDRLAVRMNALLDRITRLDEGVRQMGDAIAHDLRTPLTRLRAKADAALADTAGREEHLAGILSDTDGLIRTFDALLMISRVESGSRAAELGDVDLSALVADIAELYAPLAEEAGFAVRLDIAPALRVDGNRELLSQALSNLLDNALKYGVGADGRGTRLAVTLERAGREALVTIADGGPGIPAEARARARERFARLEPSRSAPGNGLGLSLVEAVAHLHRGVLELDEAGTEPCLAARLRLPLRDAG